MEEEARSEGTFRYKVENICKLKDAVLSPPYYVRNLPWKIMARQYPLPHHQYQKCLGFFLQCNAESESFTWSCYAQAELRLISQKPHCETFIRRIQHSFTSEENDWGFAHFLPWNDVLDPEKGYVKDEAIILEVHVTAEAPHGISWTPRNIPDIPKLSLNKTRKRKLKKAELTAIREHQKEEQNKKRTATKKKNKTNISLRPRRKVGKTAKNTKKMASRKTDKKTTKDPKYFCLVCEELYVEPIKEDWIQCGECGHWAHDSCTSYEGCGSYFCDLCQ